MAGETRRGLRELVPDSPMRALRPVFQVASGAVGTQALSAVTALLLVHWLPIPSYALYTIFVTIIGAVSVLTNAGLGPALNALIGRHWPDLRRAAWSIKAVSRARLILSVIVLPPLVIAASLLFHFNDATPGLIFGLVLCLLVSWWGDVRSRVIDQALFHVNQATRVQNLDLGLAVVRLLIVLSAHYVGILGLVVACAINAFVSFLRVIPITLWTRQAFPLNPHDDAAVHEAEEAEDLKTIRGMTTRQLPVEIMYILTPQAILSVITVALSTAQIAEYGALGRIAQLTLPVQVLTAAFILPRFARRTHGVARAFAGYLFLLSIPAAGLIAVCALFPKPILSLLGPQYAHLTTQLVWSATTAAAILITGTAWHMMANRGFNHWAWTQIPLTIAWATAYPLLHHVHSLTDVLIYQLGFSLPLAINVLLEARKGLADRPPKPVETALQ